MKGVKATTKKSIIKFSNLRLHFSITLQLHNEADIYRNLNYSTSHSITSEALNDS